MNIRQAKKQDIQGLLHLWDERRNLLLQMDNRFAKMDVNTAKDTLLAYIDDGDTHVLVAEQDKHIIGYIVGVCQDNQTGIIPEMALDAHAYHGGLGRELVNAIRHYFEEQSITHILALVPRYHPVEQAFWRTLGTHEWTNDLQKPPKELMWMKL